jgi:hypothetical protein
MFGATILFVIFGCTLLVVKLKERCLYLLFLAAYTQNLAVPLLYTHGFVSLEAARALVLAKDVMLLELFSWSVVVLFREFRPPWPRPLKPLLVLTLCCILRFLAGALFLGDNWGEGLRILKSICFPLQILVVVTVLTARKPEFGTRFLRDITYILSLLAVVAIAILVFAPRDFWVQNANIAVLQADVKGEAGEALDFGEGVPMSGSMIGRELFSFMSAFRAIGTFGEALALSFSMAVPVLLLSLHYRKSILSILALTVATTALFFSLTRSAWVFCAIVASYVIVRRGHYRIFALAGASILAFSLLFPPVGDFAASTISNISPANDNPDSEHAEGILWFYSRGFTDGENILGKGTNPGSQTIPESGYAYVLEHFGALAYASFLWFCFSIYGQLKKPGSRPIALSVFGQGIALAMLVVMHFSYYPFSLPTFMSLWYVVGLCLSNYLLPKDQAGPELRKVETRVPELQPA